MAVWTSNPNPEEVNLFLPSGVPSNLRVSAVCREFAADGTPASHSAM